MIELFLENLMSLAALGGSIGAPCPRKDNSKERGTGETQIKTLFAIRLTKLLWLQRYDLYVMAKQGAG